MGLRDYKLISIAGLKCSGKSEAAKMLEYLINAPKVFQKYSWYKIGLRFPKKWKISSFAKPLKDVLSIILNIPPHKFENREFKENWCVSMNDFSIKPDFTLSSEDKLTDNQFSKLIKNGMPIPSPNWLTVRQLMQYFGTECCQLYLGRKVWINATLNAVSKNTIISDLRFKEELNEIKKRNGIAIYIDRSSAIPGTHASEREVIELKENNQFDITIDNNGSLKDLFYNIKKFI